MLAHLVNRGYSRQHHNPITNTETVMRDWLKHQWTKLKTWTLAALAAIGITFGTMMLATAAVQFSWTLPTQNTDGSALDPAQLVETRLYCDIDPVTFIPQAADAPASHPATAVTPAPGTVESIELTFGRHDCFATVLAAYTDVDGTVVRMESNPSGIATKIVAPPQPNPPGLD